MLTQLAVHFLTIYNMQTMLHAASPSQGLPVQSPSPESFPRQHMRCSYPVTSTTEEASQASTPTLTFVPMLPALAVNSSASTTCGRSETCEPT